jgi:hypothetical protein
MADSVLKTIADLMITDIVALDTIDNAVLAMNNPSTKYPNANIEFWSAGVDVGTDITQMVDRNFNVIIRVRGLEVDDVENALEDLMMQWTSTTNFDALRDNSQLTNIQPVDNFPPQTLDGTTTSPIFGEVLYFMTVRYVSP